MQELSRHNQNIRRKILVVDDELVNRRLLGFILGRDYDVIYAENGIEALDLIRNNERTLSLIMLDLLMPEMNGYELLEIIRNDANLKRIPVIVLTSEKSAEVKSLQLGAADFIPKPYDMPEVILARVQRLIELAEDNIIIHETETDDLTELYSKVFFFQYVKRHDRYYPDEQMDAVVLNVNRFHLINELYGRDTGDLVLRTLADCIRGLISDTNGLACRCESDSFYVYKPHSEDYDHIIKTFTDKLIEAIGFTNISIRCGIYSGVDISMDVEERFDTALVACSNLRGTYTSSFAYYDTDLHEKELFSERLVTEMDEALSQKQFKVFYQPKFDIRGDKPVLTSAEALIRWFHPELGMVSPGAFIPLFESNGLIQKLDHYVWKEAAVQIKAWKDKFGLVIPVSVNVSRVDICYPQLSEMLLDIVHSNGLEPNDYLLEITESAYTDNSSQIIDTVNKLRDLGFKVEMDDFGCGYSSLNMLAALPIDALKLDMRFIRNICENEKDRRMVKLMLDIAEFLGVPVIAEGVESKEQLDLLKQMKCDIIQGYYFSKPVAPDEFEKFIVDKKNSL